MSPLLSKHPYPWAPFALLARRDEAKWMCFLQNVTSTARAQYRVKMSTNRDSDSYLIEKMITFKITIKISPGEPNECCKWTAFFASGHQRVTWCGLKYTSTSMSKVLKELIVVPASEFPGLFDDRHPSHPSHHCLAPNHASTHSPPGLAPGQ